MANSENQRIFYYDKMAHIGWRVWGTKSRNSSFMMNNRSIHWNLSRLLSLTSFSGLWKCFTIPLMASPTPSWIWPVFNSGWERKRQRCGETAEAHRRERSSGKGECCWTHALEETVKTKTEDTVGKISTEHINNLNKITLWNEHLNPNL